MGGYLADGWVKRAFFLFYPDHIWTERSSRERWLGRCTRIISIPPMWLILVLQQTFDTDVAGFAPDVLPAVEQNTAVLNASLVALQAAFV